MTDPTHIDHIWPERLMIRDTMLHDDMGGGGQRIYTTAGQGYEKREYVRADLEAKLSGGAHEPVAVDEPFPPGSFHDANGAVVTRGDRVEYRFGRRRGELRTVFHDGEAYVRFDDTGYETVKFVHLCKVDDIPATPPAEPAVVPLPQDVIDLVIAARELWECSDMNIEADALDNALKPFASRVPYENEPDDDTTAKGWDVPADAMGDIGSDAGGPQPSPPAVPDDLVERLNRAREVADTLSRVEIWSPSVEAPRMNGPSMSRTLTAAMDAQAARITDLQAALREISGVRTDLPNRSDYERGFNDARFRCKAIADAALTIKGGDDGR